METISIPHGFKDVVFTSHRLKNRDVYRLLAEIVPVSSHRQVASMQPSTVVFRTIVQERWATYRKDDRAMRPMYMSALKIFDSPCIWVRP